MFAHKIAIRALALGLTLVLTAGLAVAQDSEPSPNVAAPAALGTAFTYQGRIEDAGSPVSGTCDFKFGLFNAAAGGTQVDGTQTLSGVEVSQGFFTVPLDFGPGTFNGWPRWLEIGVRCPAGTGSYVKLSPRQALTPAPYALYAADAPDTLEGLSCASGQVAKWNAGAWICADDRTGDGNGAGTHDHWGQSWSGSGTGLTLDSSNGHGLVVSGGDHGLHVEDAGKDGVYVHKAGNASRSNPSSHNNGFEVAGAQGSGLSVGHADGYGVHVRNAGSIGVMVDRADWDGVRVISAGNTGVFVEFAHQDGFYLYQADRNGLHIERAGKTGALIKKSSWNGVVVEEAGGDGVRASGTAYNALYGDTAKGNGEWGLYTPDKIRAANVAFNTLTLIAQVSGPERLTRGDVVTAAGVAAPLPGADAALPLVRPAGAGDGVVGVVEGRMALTALPSPEGAEAPERAPELRSAEGPARAGDYVALTVLGVTQVRVGAEGASLVGTRLTAGDSGLARALRTVVVDGVTLAESTPTLGITLEEPDKDGLVWVLVNPQ